MAVASALRVEQLPDLSSERPEWQELGLRAGNPFATWEWASAWWRHFGGDRQQWILGCRDSDGVLVGVLPLYLSSRRPLRILRQMGHGPADQLGPVCLPERRERVTAAFRAALAELPGWDVCVAERLSSADLDWPAVLEGTVTRTESSPVIRFQTSDWDEWLATRSPNFRQSARRLERRLGRESELRFRTADDEEVLERDMDTLVALHEGRWAETESTVFAGKLAGFHQEVARLALAGGWLDLVFLELDGEPRAAMYSFRLGGATWFYQSGRDPDFERERVGHVLLNHTVRETLNAGLREFKLLLGTEGYKARYASDDCPVQTVAFARNRAVEAALRAAVAARARLRAGGRATRRARGAAPAPAA
jgi:CelD/BcsL family acetyltransferase involved in cellulose biosynthesis